MNLSGKNILFIAPMFFGYEKVVVQALKSRGARVDYFSDRPSQDFLTKSVIRVNRKLLAPKTNKYYDEIIEATSDVEYDHILIVRGEAISRERIRRLRSRQPGSRMTLYLWDSMYYNANARSILNEFDQCYSFDRKDAEQNHNVEFLPLFFSEVFEKSANWDGPIVYDACFIGTIHTDRYKILEQIITRLEDHGRSIYVFCYYPSRLLYSLRSLIDPGFRRFGKKHIRFTGLALEEVVERIASSSVVVDINRPSQDGVTMRTIEAIGAQRKLLTTNEDAVNYDFYSTSAVHIVDRDDPDIPLDFLNVDRMPFDERMRQRYSIDRWVTRIFE